jgi:hypothetical protein
MANHHFVAQTYLKHFGDPAEGGRLHAYRKSDGMQFPCWPAAVCHEWDGDLNPTWLREPVLLGQYRKIFEPMWNVAIARLLSNSPPHQDRFAVAGYVANLMAATPAWRRIGVQAQNDIAIGFLSFSKEMQDKHGDNSALPVKAIEALQRHEIELNHDPDFIKAQFTRQLTEHAWLIYHQDWDIIENPTAFPFVTSDNPVAFQADSLEPPTRIVAPTLALSFRATRLKPPAFDPNLPPLGTAKRHRAEPRTAKAINKQIVRCAEDLVFSSYQSAGLASLVVNNAHFRVEPEYVELPATEPDAIYQGIIIRVRPFASVAQVPRKDHFDRDI